MKEAAGKINARNPTSHDDDHGTKLNRIAQRVGGLGAALHLSSAMIHRGSIGIREGLPKRQSFLRRRREFT
jgi:hypothetical protein